MFIMQKKDAQDHLNRLNSHQELLNLTFHRRVIVCFPPKRNRQTVAREPDLQKTTAAYPH